MQFLHPQTKEIKSAPAVTDELAMFGLDFEGTLGFVAQALYRIYVSAGADKDLAFIAVLESILTEKPSKLVSKWVKIPEDDDSEG